MGVQGTSAASDASDESASSPASFNTPDDSSFVVSASCSVLPPSGLDRFGGTFPVGSGAVGKRAVEIGGMVGSGGSIGAASSPHAAIKSVIPKHPSHRKGIARSMLPPLHPVYRANKPSNIAA